MRTIFTTEEERAAPPVGKPTPERQEEYESVLGAIMRVVRRFPEVLGEVLASLDEEERLLCPT